MFDVYVSILAEREIKCKQHIESSLFKTPYMRLT